MSAQTKETEHRTEKKRSEPWSKTHRKMIEMHLNEATREVVVDMAVKEHKRSVEAEESAHDYFMKMFVFGLLEPANEQLDEKDQQNSIILHSPDGEYKVKMERKNNRGFKDFVIEAKALFQEVLDEQIDKEKSTIPVGIIKMIKSMLFGRTDKSTFRFTPALHEFMHMSEEELGDPRLVKAQEIVIKAYKVEKSRWYRTVWKYNEAQQRYVPIRPEYQVPEDDSD